MKYKKGGRKRKDKRQKKNGEIGKNRVKKTYNWAAKGEMREKRDINTRK